MRVLHFAVKLTGKQQVASLLSGKIERSADALRRVHHSDFFSSIDKSTAVKNFG
jgi:hypothetical protein